MNSQIQISFAHEPTRRSSKKTGQRKQLLNSLPHLYLFDEDPVHPMPSVAQHHNSQSRRSGTLTLRHGIRPASSEKGNRAPSEIYLANRSIRVTPCLRPFWFTKPRGTSVLEDRRPWVCGDRLAEDKSACFRKYGHRGCIL